jgi:hypothetical protein
MILSQHGIDAQQAVLLVVGVHRWALYRYTAEQTLLRPGRAEITIPSSRCLWMLPVAA